LCRTRAVQPYSGALYLLRSGIEQAVAILMKEFRGREVQAVIHDSATARSHLLSFDVVMSSIIYSFHLFTSLPHSFHYRQSLRDSSLVIATHDSGGFLHYWRTFSRITHSAVHARHFASSDLDADEIVRPSNECLEYSLVPCRSTARRSTFRLQDNFAVAVWTRSEDHHKESFTY
jgi:hypothetical protein